jgi:hypothetical protein
MKFASLLFTFLLTSSTALAQHEIIQSFQRNLIDTEITASNVAMVFKDGEVVYHHIENSLDPNGKPIYHNTIFPIWSMSKPITIVAMMTLYEDGLIDFDEKVSTYLPEFENLQCKGEKGTYECANDLTLFHLMTHRSGYGYYENPHFFSSTVKYDNLDKFVSDVANHPVEFEPGSRYLYGINMAILGKVVEEVRVDETQLLMTIPGVSYYTALTIYAELGGVNRFDDDKEAVSYVGLNPVIRKLGDSRIEGSISKRGSGRVRWLLVQAANTAVHTSNDEYLSRFYDRLISRKSSQKAIVAAARKMLVSIYHILDRREVYDPPGVTA